MEKITEFGREKALIKGSHLMGVGMMLLIVGSYQFGGEPSIILFALLGAVFCCCMLFQVASKYQALVGDYRVSEENPQRPGKD